MDQNNNQNVQAMPNQNFQMAQNQNIPVNQQPAYYQPVNNNKPTFALDEKMLGLLTNIGISGGLGFCCYFVILLIERVITKIGTEIYSYEFFDTALYNILNFIDSYVEVWLPIIVIGLSLFLLLKNKKK